MADSAPRASLCSLLLVAGLAAGCARGAADALPDLTVPPPERPTTGTLVRAGADLQAAVDSAVAGETLILSSGRFDGPIVVAKPLTIFGPRSARVVSNGKGSTIQVTANDVRLLGFSISGSGTRFDLLDSAVRIKGKGIQIEGLRITDALFGILAEDSERATIRGNRIVGTGQAAMGLRGDGIRLWGVKNSVLAHNVVTDSRDIVVWFSTDNHVHHNSVSRSRYGTHFMYGHGNVVHHNQYVDNVVGVFVMYTHNITLEHNILARSSGSAGMGLGVKESGNLKVRYNLFVQNTKGVHLDTSPHQRDHTNVFERNVMRLNDCVIAFHGRATRNEFRNNTFRDNGTLTHLAGRGDALDSTWSGNSYDEYAGYDMDGDGIGDIPHEVRRLSTELSSRYPDLEFFHGSPALGMIDVAGQVMPLFQPKLLLVDEAPRMRPASEGGPDAR